MKRIYHNYKKWEDWQNGMWGNPDHEEEPRLIDCAVKTLGDQIECHIAMNNVVCNWPICTEHNLTDKSQNRRAWLGQAACCFANGVPEHLTRLAWWKLQPNQQDIANAVADTIISAWENSLRGSQLCLKFHWE